MGAARFGQCILDLSMAVKIVNLLACGQRKLDGLEAGSLTRTHIVVLHTPVHGGMEARMERYLTRKGFLGVFKVVTVRSTE